MRAWRQFVYQLINYSSLDWSVVELVVRWGRSLERRGAGVKDKHRKVAGGGLGILGINGEEGGSGF